MRTIITIIILIANILNLIRVSKEPENLRLWLTILLLVIAIINAIWNMQVIF